MTTLIYFHQIRCRDFKTCDTDYVLGHLRAELPHLVN
jgi:hypothetical protein